MDAEKFISPKEVTVNGRQFVISQIPAINALTICNKITNAISKNGIIGITMLPEDVDRDILSYTAISEGGIKISPDTDRLFSDIFKEKIADAKELVILMITENFGFLIRGDLLGKLAGLVEATDSGS